MPEVLGTPRGGVPPLVSTIDALSTASAALAAGHGPIAVDTERASGFRYDERAFLLQIKRDGAGIVLIDPVPLRQEIAALLGPVMNSQEWIIHAAATDLGCLHELGLVPARIFDTELAGRFCGVDRVNLASMAEQFLGQTLLKGYGAADWSKRPLPEDWLTYAALDVELLIELKAALVPELSEHGTIDWFEQECEFIRQEFAHGDPHPDKTWRDTKRISKVRKPNQLAILRALWKHRDTQARKHDVAVSRLLPDRIMAEIAIAAPRTRGHLVSVAKKNGSFVKNPDQWVRIVNQTLKSNPQSWPRPQRRNLDEAPARKDWAHLNPTAAIALEQVTQGLQDIQSEYEVPLENLIKPAVLRDVLWEHFTDHALRSADDVDAALDNHSVRRWQKDLVVPLIVQTLGI